MDMIYITQTNLEVVERKLNEIMHLPVACYTHLM